MTVITMMMTQMIRINFNDWQLRIPQNINHASLSKSGMIYISYRFGAYN